MPVRKRLERTRPPTADELVRRLHNEWTNPAGSGQPLIVIEGSEGSPIHVYVIWDEWRDMAQVDRSEIIMDVVENLTGNSALPPNSPVTVAMGLTAEEANRMGIKSQ